ncbi:MAG: hypothetical protein ABIJ61_11700, partial [bacterium]
MSGNYFHITSSELISAPFVVPASGENPRLRFWHWFYANDWGDQGYVQLIKDGVATRISPVWDISTTMSVTSDIWTSPSLDLSAWGGDTVQLSFYFYTDSDGSTNPGWYIDDIEIVTGPYEDLAATPETFEDGLLDWSSSRGMWEVGVPTSGPGSAHSGSQCAATVLSGNYFHITSSELISAPFVVPASGENPRLRFWHWFYINDYGDGGYVQVVAGDSTTKISPTYNLTSGEWIDEPPIDLSAWGGDTVQLSFYFYTDSDGSTNPGWYIDDIRLVSDQE